MSLIDPHAADEDEAMMMQRQGDTAPKPVRILDLLDPHSPHADTHTRRSRMSVCKSCEELNFLDQCGICHCFMRAKTWLLDAECPIGKW